MVKGLDAELWHWSSVAGWESVGGRLASTPLVLSWGSLRLDAIVRGTDNGVWHAWFGTAWHWESLGGSTASGLAAVARGNQLHVFVQGLDRGLWLTDYQ